MLQLLDIDFDRRIERFEFADGAVWAAANDGVIEVRRVG